MTHNAHRTFMKRFIALTEKSKNRRFRRYARRDAALFNPLTSALRVPCMPRGRHEQAYVHMYIINSIIK